jgi:hypothetical protein
MNRTIVVHDCQLSRQAHAGPCGQADRRGQYSIRINDQWRICFEWPGGSPEPTEVEIVDYH